MHNNAMGQIMSRMREEAMITRDESMIGPIAAFIGARLQYPCPEVNGQGNPWTSTIRVDQHKEKFWGVVVYCNLADPDLVREKWVWIRENKEQMGKLPRRVTGKLGKLDADYSADEPSDAFKARCLFHDAMHYRECYLDMIALQPHLRGAICMRADHGELLLDQFSELEERVKDKPEYLESFCRKYHIEDPVKAMEFLHSVYEPTTKQRYGFED
jgi:hypothetical protein